MTRSKFIKYAIFAVIFIFFLLPIISSILINKSSNDDNKRLTDKAKSELDARERIYKSIPTQQIELANLSDSIRSRAKKTDNIIALNELRDEFGERLCKVNPTITSWVATIISIQKNVDHRYYVFLKDQFNNEFRVERIENSIALDDPLVDKLKSINMNQLVRFSGSLYVPKFRSISSPGENCVRSSTWADMTSYLHELQAENYRYDILLTDISLYK